MNKKGRLESICTCFLLLAGATAAGYFFKSVDFSETNIVVVYILAVLLSARMTDGYGYGVMESVLATATFNYFFTSPYFSLNVDNPAYLITFVIMTVTALITSAVTSKAKINALAANEREAETAVLYRLTSSLAAAGDPEDIAGAAVAGISGLLRCPAGCILTGPDGKLEGGFIQQTEEGKRIRRKLPEKEELEAALRREGTEGYLDGKEFRDWPVYVNNRLLASFRIPFPFAAELSAEQEKLLRAMMGTAGLALDRQYQVKRRMQDQEMIEKERERANLLRSISHDLRTPLAGIMGTSEMLQDMTQEKDPRMPMLQDIYRDADWLHGLVENILSLTRLQDGRLVLHKAPEACEEVIEAALRHVKKRAPDREIDVEIPEELLMVPMDARLVGQVLVNLVDNAVKHTRKEERIVVRVSKREDAALFEVEDTGIGISQKDMPHIFQLFYTSNGEYTDRERGMGIGLAICEAVVRAHGGSIGAENRKEGKGAVFSFCLPLE